MSYLGRVGRECDVFLNVLTGGAYDETVSLRVARAARDGGPVACAVCRCLDVLVQPDHCAKQFGPEATPVFDAVRAGIAFAFVISMIYGAVSMTADAKKVVKPDG